MIENGNCFVIQHNVDKAQLSLLQKKESGKKRHFEITNICPATIIDHIWTLPEYVES